MGGGHAKVLPERPPARRVGDPHPRASDKPKNPLNRVKWFQWEAIKWQT